MQDVFLNVEILEPHRHTKRKRLIPISCRALWIYTTTNR